MHGLVMPRQRNSEPMAWRVIRRMDAGQTQQEVAQAIGVSQSVISFSRTDTVHRRAGQDRPWEDVIGIEIYVRFVNDIDSFQHIHESVADKANLKSDRMKTAVQRMAKGVTSGLLIKDANGVVPYNTTGNRQLPHFQYYNRSRSRKLIFRQYKVKVDLSVVHNCVKSEIFFYAKVYSGVLFLRKTQHLRHWRQLSCAVISLQKRRHLDVILDNSKMTCALEDGNKDICFYNHQHPPFRGWKIVSHSQVFE
ncbi:hypothetical protein C0J52_18850 [Blattella germanica]|nr:hypothetical protein C0J52_18850 [Blattella germanica]